MGTAKCPYGDGDCSYADRALLMVRGRLSVITSDAAERVQRLSEYDDLDELDAPGAYDELVDLVLEAQRAESPLGGEFGGSLGYAARDLLQNAEQSLTRRTDDDSLIVYCTPCGHVLRKRLA